MSSTQVSLWCWITRTRCGTADMATAWGSQATLQIPAVSDQSFWIRRAYKITAIAQTQYHGLTLYQTADSFVVPTSWSITPSRSHCKAKCRHGRSTGSSESVGAHLARVDRDTRMSFVRNDQENPRPTKRPEPPRRGLHCRLRAPRCQPKWPCQHRPIDTGASASQLSRH